MENWTDPIFILRAVRYRTTDDEIVCKAAKIEGVKYSEFVRKSCLERAKRTIRRSRKREEQVVA
jgi:uncharacterized protein (DUF1778 family)